MSRNRARNNTIVHPKKKSNADKREKKAMAMAKDVRKEMNSMDAIHIGPDTFVSLIRERVLTEIDLDHKRQDFWRLVGKRAFDILVKGEDLAFVSAPSE